MPKYKMDGTELEQNPTVFEPIERGQPIVEFIPVIPTGVVRIAHQPSGTNKGYTQEKRSWRIEFSKAPNSLVRRFKLRQAYQEAFTWEAIDYDADSTDRAPTSNPSGDNINFFAPEHPLVDNATFRVFVSGTETTAYTATHLIGLVTLDAANEGEVTLEYTWKATFKIDSFTARRANHSPGRWDCEGVLTEI